MPSKTEWMIAHSVNVQGFARPASIVAERDETNSVAALMIQRTSGHGALVIEGRPEDLVALAQKLTDAAARIVVETESTPALRAMYGRTD